jgi:hypothetical protein
MQYRIGFSPAPAPRSSLALHVHTQLNRAIVPFWSTVGALSKRSRHILRRIRSSWTKSVSQCSARPAAIGTSLRKDLRAEEEESSQYSVAARNLVAIKFETPFFYSHRLSFLCPASQHFVGSLP